MQVSALVCAVAILTSVFAAAARADERDAAQQWKPTDWIVYCATTTDERGQATQGLFRIRPDGSQRTLLATGDRAVRSPSVSSIGRKIAYFNWPQVHVCDFDGSNDLSVTPIPREHFQPAWSPDGQRIAFTTDRDNNAEIYVMHHDGADQANLTWRRMSAEMDAAWSPDGERIAFASDRGGTFDLYVMDADGRDPRALTDSLDGTCRAPAWSPDGERIAFARDHGGTCDLYLIDADGSNLRRLTEGADWNGQPAWNADGTQLAFISTRGGGSDVWTMDLETGALRNVTDNPASNASFPTWVPAQRADEPLVIEEAVVSAIELPRPRVLIQPNDLDELRQRFETEPYRESWEQLLARCDRWVEQRLAGEGSVASGIEQIADNLRAIREPLAAARDLGFAFQVTGRDTYGETGAALLHEICRRIAAHHPRASIGWREASSDALPAAFDWLHAALDESQRRTVRGVLLRSAERKYLSLQTSHAGFAPTAVASPTANNVVWVNAGYLGNEALALLGEPGYEADWLHAALELARRVNERWFDKNGAPTEGDAYFNWTGNMVAPFLISAIRTGIAPDLADTNMRRFPRWMALTAHHGVRRMPMLGDSNGGPPRLPIEFLAIYPDDPLIDLLWRRGAGSDRPAAEVRSLLWWRPTRDRVDPATHLPRSALFVKPGYAVFRSGFGDDDPVMTISAPQYAGHAHPEGGAFTLFGYGAEFAVDPGYGIASAEAQNHVLVNGRGRAKPWSDASEPFLRRFTRSDFADAVTADVTDAFAARQEGYRDYPIPLPWYPMRRAVRHGVMVHDGDAKIPPYFLLHDDYERDGEVNTYQFLTMAQLDQRIEPSDHEVRMRPAYEGSWLEVVSEDEGEGAASFPLEVADAGHYDLWLYIQGGNRVDLSIGEARHALHVNSVPTRGDAWQWRRAATAREREPIALALEAGERTLTLHATGRTPKVARVLLTPAGEQEEEPWHATPTDAPAGSILLRTEEAERVTGAWRRRAPAWTERDGRPQMALHFLNPEPVSFETLRYRYRTVHFGQQRIELPQLRATREAVNPRFLVLAYPHRAGMMQPRIERGPQGGPLTAKVHWDDAATDHVIVAADGRLIEQDGIRTDARLAVVRRYADGRVGYLVVAGTTLRIEGEALLQSDQRTTQGALAPRP
ncbi:MAG: hypothetical protein ACODAQ_04610 [Phycisphaeraceae bacterium]